VLVATDTLAVYPDGRPYKFVSKAFIVPRLRLVMAGVGVAGFLAKWFIRIYEDAIVRGIDALDVHTTKVLRELWKAQQSELSVPENCTTTVYHLGFSETTGLIHQYAYRSANDFKSELLQPYGLRWKPECQVDSHYVLPKDFAKIMEEQRRVEATKPHTERVYIGGEIEVRHLTKEGFQVYTCHRFPDYDEVEAAIYRGFESLKTC
jgi:hypothetical protein